MTNICILIRSLAHGGAEKQCLMLVKALKGYANVHLIILDEQPQHEKHLNYIAKEGLPNHFLKGSALKKFAALRTYLRDHKIQMMFTYLPSDTIIGGLAGRLENVPHIIGGIRNAELGRAKRVVLHQIYNHCLHYAISNSYTGRDNFIQYGYSAERLLVMPNGIELDQVKRYRSPKEPIKIISVGRYVEQKDLETGIKTFQWLKKNLEGRKQVKLQLIGYGELEEQVRGWIKHYRLEDDVEMIISPPNLGDYYAEADLYLCTSLVEGLSNSLMEAMSYSLPIVATDAGDNNQLAREGQNGNILPIGDYKALAAALQKLVEDDALRAEYSSNSFDIISENYTYEAFQKNYRNLIESILENDLVPIN
ncbi:MAG: glycosyltransferase family 4 protein [Bacteroidota bacterium]